ncbi:hypothetical protein AA23498_2197 [Acetobacter nitrogenifigens DSM 23921 = NBRC 105050]|uniref:DUF551 domain-containing protein n=1 Tax=Acetobacter nitrogenifigens DSM 23921 = NBRC 105050 TaxID=1120919 RepID=A0A511X6Y8_9PROT|nr:phage protein [Acetobacter nitrogenifigens]GBQ95074.1 hypothetical protein AA23498_2197 [Acetobacter nitrogenifigens DSM 23921 = NBRC 105050]GEN58702.1 hypothetical protein ANI02nite_05860 [Acetobacter nitrogenifigens DSM 23921 = NBRC 105050]
MISEEQLEAAARSYYDYCDGSWETLNPMAQSLYRTRMRLALNTFVATLWRDIASAPKDGTAVLLFNHIDGRGDYTWLDRWDPEYGRWIAAPKARATHWMPIPPPPGSS